MSEKNETLEVDGWKYINVSVEVAEKLNILSNYFAVSRNELMNQLMDVLLKTLMKTIKHEYDNPLTVLGKKQFLLSTTEDNMSMNIFVTFKPVTIHNHGSKLDLTPSEEKANDNKNHEKLSNLWDSREKPEYQKKEEVEK